MHVLLCNERLCFRFGLDRVLILLGRHLHSSGHRVTVLVNRCDADSVAGWADRVIEVPSPEDYLQSNEQAAAFVERQWPTWFAPEEAPDVALIGGWPFLSSIDLLERFGVRTVFFECGAVPLDGYEGGALTVQLKLRELRKRHLPQASHIGTISVFTAESQSRVDSEGNVPITSILLGANHLEDQIWPNTGTQSDRPYLKDEVERILGKGMPIVLQLGRWEPGSYKNTEAVFPILDGIRETLPEARALILADPATTKLPRGYRDRVLPIGFPGDDELQDLMKRVDLGIVPSRWEGFGLPLAEMQWIRRPVLAFDDGAHPEVAVHPWYLCKTNEEMAEKAVHILTRSGMHEIPQAAYDRFCANFRWDQSLARWQALLEDVYLRDRRLHVVFDVTSASIDTANSGVIRVTRQLAREFQLQVDTTFVRWDDEAGGYVHLTEEEYDCLAQYNGPQPSADAVVSSRKKRLRLGERFDGLPAKHTWLCFSETVRAPVMAAGQEFARRQGWKVAAVFYDAIPTLHPEFVQDRQVLENHADYMRRLADCDMVVPISGFSAECLKSFWEQQGIPATAVEVDLLSGQFAQVDLGSAAAGAGQHHAASANGNSAAAGHTARILCVSTVEPRKNHLRLIDACLALKKRRPDLNWQLDLVGNRYAGAEELADSVTAACQRHPEIRWLGVVDDDTLVELYRRADFTVYPSLIEGFGVPIVESLAFGKPCLCADTGVMAELAAEGGCLTVDVHSAEALSQGIERLLAEPSLGETLSEQARSRPVRSWEEYAEDFARILVRHRPQDKRRLPTGSSTTVQPGGRPIPHTVAEGPQRDFHIDEALYPRCLCERWQMNHSERMALRALLEHLRPQCAIEIGTYHGGSLSLIAQHTQVVFSIDIEPMPPEVRVFPNVSFLTGPSAEALPTLLEELRRQDIDPQLVLIDGDHSREGVARDLRIVLEQPVRSPLWVVMHDSMNPGCRAGMLDVDWAANPQVHFVDLDFVPGRIVEHGGGSGELWGGLAFACLLPQPRRCELQVQQSARQMMEVLVESRAKPAAPPENGNGKTCALAKIA